MIGFRARSHTSDRAHGPTRHCAVERWWVASDIAVAALGNRMVRLREQ